jgi:DNA polymerase sigma
MSSEDGIDAIPIVKEYLDKMPALRPLVLVVKAMLRRANLGSAASSGLNSYSVVLMAISYLQVSKFLSSCDINLMDVAAQSQQARSDYDRVSLRV